MNYIPSLKIYPAAPAPIVQQPLPIDFPSPLSYDFQVKEYIEDGKVVKVSLQVKVNQHDAMGNISVHGTWIDVPRVKVDMNGDYIP